MIDWCTEDLEWTPERRELWGVPSFKLAQQMLSQPPKGHNHGLARGHNGGFRDLNTRGEPLAEDGYDVDSFIESRKTFKRPRSKKPFETVHHGTMAAYTNDNCRCDLRKTVMRDYFRKRRAKSVDNEETNCETDRDAA